MRVFASQVGLGAFVSLLALTGPAAGDSSSIAGAGQSGWTTPPGGSLQDAPSPVNVPWTGPAAPPAPPASTVVESAPYVSQGNTYAAPAAPGTAAAPCWNGCGMPCSDGLSMWYLTGVFGRAWQFGDDSGEDCWYWGFDVGRTFCGCWGLDLFYRYHSSQYDRANPPQPTKDGGEFHHVGIKFTYDFPISGRLYGWAGIGPEYWWTQGYLDDDDGFGVFGELGVGYVVSRNIRLRAGVNVHGIDTDVTRNSPADDGQSRWLWILAPVIEVEFAF